MKKNSAVNKYHDEGNNGGDYFLIEKLEDGLAYVEVGHCCVITVSKTVPVEALTAIFTKIFFENNPDISDVIPWSGEYKEKILKKIKDRNRYTYESPNPRRRPNQTINL